jgi:opacity protein-like surface antigen
MKSAYLLTAALLVATISSAVADDAAAPKKPKPGKHNPSGTFVWESDVGGSYISSQLKLALRGKKLTGEYSDDNVSLEIENGAFDGKTLSFTLEFDVDGTEVKADVTGVVDGDSLKGTTKLNLNGETFDLPIDAKRKTSRRDVVGEWKLTVETEAGEAFEPTVTIAMEKGKLKGTYDEAVAGQHELTDLDVKDNKLTFTIGGDASDGTPFTAKFSGKPRGDRIHGKADVVIGEAEMTATIRGKRTVDKKAE